MRVQGTKYIQNWDQNFPKYPPYILTLERTGGGLDLILSFVRQRLGTQTQIPREELVNGTMQYHTVVHSSTETPVHQLGA